MGWPDTLIAAAAAVAGGIIGAYASLRQTRATLSSDKALQDSKFEADKDLSREAREYQQRRDAYVPMMTYVTWAARVNQVRTAVIDRRATALQEVRPANVQNVTAADVVAMRAAYDNNGPTEWEQKMIDAGPAPEEKFRILGMVNAFASKDVLDKFLQVVDSTETIEKAYVSAEKALMDFPSPLGPQPSIDEVSAAAIRQIESSANMFGASRELLKATKRYSDVVVSVRDTARAELDRIRSKVEPSRS